MVLTHALHPSGIAATVLRLVSLLGWVIWVVSFWRMDNLRMRTSREPCLVEALSEQRAQAIRYRIASLLCRSLGVTLGTLLAVQCLFIVVSVFAPQALSALVVAEANLLIGVSVFMGSFLYLEQRGIES